MTKPYRACIFASLVTLSACGTPAGPCALAVGPDRVYVLSGDWHSEIAIPVSELGDGLEELARKYPGARSLVFGYGKKSFMTAPPGSLAKYLTGPWPGAGAIEVTALDGDPAALYAPDEIVTLDLPADGARRLSAHIRGDMANDPDGMPRIVEEWHDPETLFIDADSRYTFLHTCNGWLADGLAAAGVPISTSRVITSGRLMARAGQAAILCTASAGAGTRKPSP